jgi:hypothetical protein
LPCINYCEKISAAFHPCAHGSLHSRLPAAPPAPGHPSLHSRFATAAGTQLPPLPVHRRRRDTPPSIPAAPLSPGHASSSSLCRLPPLPFPMSSISGGCRLVIVVWAWPAASPFCRAAYLSGGRPCVSPSCCRSRAPCASPACQHSFSSLPRAAPARPAEVFKPHFIFKWIIIPTLYIWICYCFLDSKVAMYMNGLTFFVN